MYLCRETGPFVVPPLEDTPALLTPLPRVLQRQLVVVNGSTEPRGDGRPRLLDAPVTLTEEVGRPVPLLLVSVAT